MSYENEIQHLMRELKSAKSSYLNARLNSEDALMRHALKTDVETIEFQIDVFEKAAKTNEYEAKAKLADDIITAWKTGDFDFTEGEGSLPDHGIAPVPNYHMFDFGQYVDSLLDEYESGERNES